MNNTKSNAKDIAEKIIKKGDNTTFEDWEIFCVNNAVELARAYLELEKEKARLKLHIDDIEKANDNCQTKIANLELEITKLKEENEALSKDLKMCREIGVEMQREVNRKLSVENEKLKKSRDVLRKAVEFYKMNKHWNIVPMLGERVLDKGYTAREAIKSDDEIMGG